MLMMKREESHEPGDERATVDPAQGQGINFIRDRCARVYLRRYDPAISEN
jgi:hypothetical protein